MERRRATLSEVLASLSQALDMVEGQPAGHAVRTSRIAVKLCETMGLPEGTIVNGFFGSLLKDCGCSNNSARIHKIFGGDDFLNKRDVKFIDWSNPIESAKYALSHVERGQSIRVKLKKFAAILAKESPSQVMNANTEARCTRGSAIALGLGFSFEVAGAIQALDEHWDGKGAPRGIAGDKIPLLARILCLAQTLEVFVTTFGISAAYEMVSKRTGRWFDPEVSQAALAIKSDRTFWEGHFAHVEGTNETLPISEDRVAEFEIDIDAVCRAYAQIIDAKSTFTGEHSVRVTEYSVALATHLGFDAARLKTLERAALLHDIGKLGVPNSILDKPAKLTEEEFDIVKRHPENTYNILSHIPGFYREAEIAAAHHERLDGRGYHLGLTADFLDLDMRILTACDVFDALSAERPYRAALPLSEVFSIMDKGINTAFDPVCLDGLKDIYRDREMMAA